MEKNGGYSPAGACSSHAGSTNFLNMREELEKIIEAALVGKVLSRGLVEEASVCLSSHTCSRDDYYYGPPDCQTIEAKVKISGEWINMLE